MKKTPLAVPPLKIVSASHRVYPISDLRVATISALLDKRVSLATVAAVAGHSSLRMMLHYYYKANASKMPSKIGKASKNRPNLNPNSP